MRWIMNTVFSAMVTPLCFCLKDILCFRGFGIKIYPPELSIILVLLKLN